MCGIVGLFPFPLKTEDDKINNVAKSVIHRALFSETLVALEPRGKDSSGIALLWNDKKTAVLKQPIPSPIFVRDDGNWTDHIDPDNPDVNFKSFMSLWHRGIDADNRLRAAFGHVRKGTKGSPYNGHNNHPIIVPPSGKLEEGDSLPEGTIVGVHNGGIQNDTKLFTSENLEQIGEVDSEVIFQLMSKYKDDMSTANLKKTFDDLEGAFAVMAYNNAIPNKIGCLREVRPMEAAYFPALGTLIIVSERKYLDEAWVLYDRWRVREADMDIQYTDENGETRNAGKVGDLCPYINYTWYGEKKLPYNVTSSVEAGVFVLDLDTEVSYDTKPEDLIKVTEIIKKATGNNYTGGAYGGHRSKSSTLVSDHRSAAKSKTSTTSSKEDKEKDTKTEVVDTTDYSKKEEPISTDVETDETDDGVVVEYELSEIEEAVEAEEEEEERECPYSWEELLDNGKRFLYKQELQDNKNILLNKDVEVIQNRFRQFLVPVKDANSMASMLGAIYDLVFPESWALGFEEGYEQASLEYSAIMEGGVSEESDTQDKLTAAYNMLTQMKEKKDKATRLLSTFGPLLSMFLSESNVLKDDGNVDMEQMTKLMTKAGVKEPTKWGVQVASALAKKKKA